MTKAQARKDYDKLSAAFNGWLKASLKLSKRVYSRRMLAKIIKRERPFDGIHGDAIEVMGLLRGMAGLKSLLVAFLLCAGVSASAQDAGTAQGSVSASMGAFMSSNSASLEGAIGACVSGQKRLYLGLPTIYWPASTQHFKWGIGASWRSTEDGWGKPQAATAFSMELVETGKRIFAGTSAVAAPWTKRWQVWGSAGTAFPRENWLHQRSWKMDDLLFLGVNVSARVL